MYRESFKPGEAPPNYEEIAFTRGGQGSTADVRHVQTSMPWWNPRYWRKRVWGGVVAAILIIIAIVIAVAVTQTKKNAYPDYSALSYSLSETCK